MSERLTDDFDIIERYFDGKLGKKERLEFEERLAAEPKFKTNYDFYAALVEGIREARRTELKHYLHQHTESIRARKSVFFGLLPYLLTFLLIFGAVYFVTENYIPQYSIPRVFNKVDSLIRVPYKAVVRNSEEQLRKELERKRTTKAEEPEAEVQEEEKPVVPETPEPEGDYINVAEDEWLGDTIMTPLGFNPASPADSASERRLPVTVEFWSSPLSFRGYQFNGKKLLLYGILPAQKTELLFADGDIYLHVNKKYFYLEEDGKFHMYRAMEAGLVRKLLER